MSSVAHDRRCIYVVDDSESIRFVLLQVLAQAFEGVDVEGFASAPMALDAIASRAPAVVITDYKMPGMDGLDFIQRARQASPQTRFVLSSGYSDLPVDILAKAGDVMVADKPMDPGNLIHIVRRFLPKLA